ncbi:phosphoadenosine phosphosulfate reductase [Aestuariibius insulae]|uniref:phosphoadenosine phosphosulfate reductase n=1 Tax=Aestuariibius insulae TaxID=2058287 RepID=UPI00345EA8AA
MAFLTDGAGRGLAGLERAAWLSRIEDIVLDHGEFEPLGPDHSAVFLPGGNRLIVTFETIDHILESPDAEPLGFRYTRKHGWSSLSLFSDGKSWFRHEAIYQSMDRMIDEGIFESFEQVVFFGAGPCGYAAAAYSVAAPGSTVIAVRPQATLDPTLAGWDDRFRDSRHQDFTSRYGYAPEMIEGADKVFVLYDPHNRRDAMHAALFHKPQTELLACPMNLLRTDKDIDAIGLLDPMIEAAMSGNLTRNLFYALYRHRRFHLPYLRGLVLMLEARGKHDLAARVCGFGQREHPHKFFDERLAKASETAPGLTAQT